MTKSSLLITLFSVAAISWSCTEAKTADLKPPTPVKVQAVERFSVNTGLRYSATIRPATQMELSFKNGGFVDYIHPMAGRLVDQGDTVAQGTVLARVRQADFEDRMDQANSQLMDARSTLESMKAKAAENRARFERAEQDFQRAETLFNSQSLTKPNLDAARAEYEATRAKVDSSAADVESARARIRGAEAVVADAKLALHDTAIVAPMSGTIMDRTIEIGSLMPSGKSGFVFADTRSVKAVFGVPDLEIRSVKPGMTLNVTSEALPEQTFTGRITSVSPAADEKSRIFETEVTIPNPKGALKAGMIASVVLGAAAAEKLAAVPLSAIVRAKDGSENYAVFVIENQGTQPVARLRSIKLGDALGNMIVVKDGLNVGDNVITVGATLVRDGSAVQIVP
jgi:RND family efflux transporter MFP subunit